MSPQQLQHRLGKQVTLYRLDIYPLDGRVAHLVLVTPEEVEAIMGNERYGQQRKRLIDIARRLLAYHHIDRVILLYDGEPVLTLGKSRG